MKEGETGAKEWGLPRLCPDFQVTSESEEPGGMGARSLHNRQASQSGLCSSLPVCHPATLCPIQMSPEEEWQTVKPSSVPFFSPVLGIELRAFTLSYNPRPPFWTQSLTELPRLGLNL